MTDEQFFYLALGTVALFLFFLWLAIYRFDVTDTSIEPKPNHNCEDWEDCFGRCVICENKVDDQ